MRQETPKSSAMRRLTPTEDSSWTLLRTHLVIWILFGLLWISWQFWGDGSTSRRLLGVVLTLVAIAQTLSTVGLMRRKRQKEREQPPV
ncbi:hypothetical protein [Streptomyces sp. ICBB 8177]|uniref:hypothetical protein n=1 Tax=Streptomyces sp. ICBB 8177 TaxID=563922 RepID=UPI000D681477|nr:hypothetical protein [Streptomyces sp. ICBB 8177]PWI45919.1 hypothetical protein CK485_01865 [Streptomyces sp. ICBB 8177]